MKLLDIYTKNTDAILPEDLPMLLDAHDKSVVSICMPVQLVEAQVQQNPIRLKNLLREAEQRLLERDVGEAEISELLAPAQELLREENVFWLHRDVSLVLFLEPGHMHTYSLPVEVEERVVIGRRFHVRPLIRVLQHQGVFYVLALNLGGIHLYEATRFDLNEVALEDVPLWLEEALRYDDFERQIQHHTSSSRHARGKQTAVFHGQGVAGDDARVKQNILRFFRQVDNGVRNVLGSEQAPLILVGVGHLQGIYREANHYTHLIDGGIDCNPEELSASELHRRALAVASPLLNAERDEAVERYSDLSGSDRAADALKTVVPAAYHQRVDTLFVPEGVQCTGTFDPSDHAALQEDNGGIDLIDEAVAHSLLNAGKVYVLPQNDMPARSVAAIFRY